MLPPTFIKQKDKKDENIISLKKTLALKDL